MPPINPVTRRTLLAIITGFVTYNGLQRAAAASERDSNHQRPISIAVPNFSGSSASGEVNARDITEIIASDLKSQMIAAQYGLQLENWRRVPHAIAEAILKRLIG